MPPPLHLVVIGGGQSAKNILFGLAERLARGERDLAGLRVSVVESSAEFGTGLAWSRRYALPQHLSSLAEPFSRVTYGDGQRRQFAGVVRLLIERGLSVNLLPCREAIDLELANGRFQVALSTGETLDADFVVLATGHWRPADPLAGIDGYCSDPWPADRLQDAISDDQSGGKPRRVIVLGGYLNAIDFPGIVVGPPFFDDLAGLLERIEQMFVEALVTQASVEALDEGISASVCPVRCSAIRHGAAAAMPG